MTKTHSKSLKELFEELTDFLETHLEEHENEFEEALSGTSFGLEYYYKQKFGSVQSVSLLVTKWLPLFRKLKAGSIKDFHEKMNEEVKDTPELQDLYQELQEAETEWNKFLELKLDPSLNQHLGEIPKNVESGTIFLRDIDTGLMVPLSQHLETQFTLFVLLRYYGSESCIELVEDIHKNLKRFTKRDCAVVLVCKGTVEGGREWRQKTQLNLLPFLADENGEFVDGYKFGRCVWNSCRSTHSKSMAAKIVQRGGQILKSSQQAVIPDKGHDVHQIGGEIILRRDGSILCFHKSLTFEDRPSAEQILNRLPKEKTEFS